MRSEDEPAMMLNLPNGEFEATRENTSLFTFLGRLACYNHVFIQTGDQDENTIIGTYVFNTHPVYEQMQEYMVENDYPLHLNQQSVAACDQNAWERMVSQQAFDLDRIPEEWLGGEADDTRT